MAEQMELKLWEDVRLEPTQVEWIVNDLAELGVRIGGRCYFLYKGRSLEYPSGEYAEGTPVLVRRVEKREYGETCWPVGLERLEDRYTAGAGWEPIKK